MIDRARWGVNRRVNGQDVLHGGALYNSGKNICDNSQGAKGKMCCLGFLVWACGAKVKDITDVTYPAPGTVPDGFEDGGVWACRAAPVNDNIRLTVRNKEAKLKQIFARAGIKVRFVGKMPAPKKAA